VNSGISAFYVPRSTKDVINNLEDVLLMSSTGNVLHIDREVGVVTNGSPCPLLTHLVTLVKRSQSDIHFILRTETASALRRVVSNSWTFLYCVTLPRCHFCHRFI